MPQQATPAPAAPQGPAAAPGGSIRDTFMRRLAGERGDAPQAPRAERSSAPQPPPQRPATRAPEPAQAAQDHDLEAPAPVADDGYQTTEPLDAPDGSQEPLEGDQQDTDSGDELGAVQAELERLQKREKELTGDYTRKTMRLAEKSRQIEQDGTVVRQTAQMLAGMIDHPARQFDNVPWAQLQTQKPEEYQRLRAQYEQVMTARNNVLQLIADMEQQQDAAVEQHRRSVAEESREILKASIPGWSNAHYTALRDLAGEFGYSPDEIDRTIDHRFIELLHAVHGTRSATEKLTGIARTPPQQRPQGANRPVMRNTQGQFQNARQALVNNPGNKQAARGYFAAKLAAERNRK